MDSRFALIGVPLAQAVMEKQRDETPVYWPGADGARPQTQTPSAPPRRASIWRALPGIAAMWRLFAVI